MVTNELGESLGTKIKAADPAGNPAGAEGRSHTVAL